MKPILGIYGIQDRYTHHYPAYTHDHNLTILENGAIKQYLHLERYTRRKNDNRLHLFIEELIDQKILDLQSDFDLISVNSFVGESFLSKNGRLRIDPIQPMTVRAQAQKASAWFQRFPWEGKAHDAWIVSHELAHVFSCIPFFGTFKENSLLIHFDGGASLGNFSAFHFKNNQLHLLEYHWELSHLSKLFNDNALSFALMKAEPGEHCSVPGKLMGYAAMGESSEQLESWLIENNYFKDVWNDQNSFYESALENFDWNGNLNENNDFFLMNIAAAFQSIFQQKILKKITELQEQTKTDYLYYTGGCALNIVTNSALVRSNLFKDVFIPPACNDAGLSLGAVAYLNWSKGNKTQVSSPYLNDIGSVQPFKYNDGTIVKVADRIAKGDIIGICNGHGEAGPRALGNRSIIARADDKQLAKKVSMECKGREWFRPIAPIMLERNARKVTGQKEIHHLSKYMLLDFKIKEEYKRALEGVIHKNGTARIQTLYTENDNPFLFDLLDYLERQFGIIALINTSFNKQGEPIVQTTVDAVIAATQMKLDGLILNGNYQTLKYELENN